MSNERQTETADLPSRLRETFRAWSLRSLGDETADEIDRLREDAAQAYQAAGFLADCLGYWQMDENDPRQHQITKLLDNLFAASEGNPRPHKDLLPFGWQV